MDNPFKKRATEFIEEPLALISVLSAEPIRAFFDKDAQNCFDRLTLVIGTPGSGKTTIARLLELDTLAEVIRLSNNKDKEALQLAIALGGAKVLERNLPTLLAQRIPCGSNLRSIWELPYSPSVRSGLLHTLIQVKTCLGWLRKLERLKVDLASVKINIRAGAEADGALIKAGDTLAFREHARQIEEDVLRAITALVPPSEEELKSSAANWSYALFDCIDSITVPPIPNVIEEATLLRPMVILDDAHELNSNQFADVDTWLLNRELKVSRWIITRVDAIGPTTFRKAISDLNSETPVPGSTEGRDRTVKLLQGENADRVQFRKIARDVSRRYFTQMPAIQMRGVTKLEDCLSAVSIGISKSDLKVIEDQNANVIRENRFSKESVDGLIQMIPEELPDDEKAAVLHILLQRERRKTPQVDMFADATGGEDGDDAGVDTETGDDGEEDGEATELTEAGVRKVQPALVHGAALQLAHKFDRPFYFSFDRLADSSGNNIEIFISLAGALTDELETQLLRKRGKPELDARQQHLILTSRAKQIMSQWDFPHRKSVEKLVSFIARRCVERTMAPNAPLSAGANTFGIPQQEMDRLETSAPELVQVIHYAIAYNAISLQENYKCKKKLWCLFLLGGVPIVANKLPLGRGGFCEGHLSDLQESIA